MSNEHKCFGKRRSGEHLRCRRKNTGRASVGAVDTGRLRSSIGASQSGDGAVAYAEENYAVYVEFGTYKMAAQPFLMPALSAAEGAVMSAVAGGLSL